MSEPAEVLSTEGAVGDVPFGTRSLKLQDYYAVLGVPRSATQDDISNAYRLAAIKWHPQRHSEGAPTKVNAMDVYETFFGSVSPFADLLRERQEAAKRMAESQGPAAEYVLGISLQEAVRGTVKAITLEGGRQFRVDVPPGTVNGTVLSYEGMGLEEAGASRPGPLLVTVRFGPQEGLTLCPEGSGDLHYTKEVGLWESFLGMNLEIIDLASGRVMRLAVDEPVTAATSKRFIGRGAPRQTGGTGDLVVHFAVKFPRDVIDEIIMVYTLDTPLELMALALVNRATLRRTRELLHRMAAPDVDAVLASPAGHEPFMLRFSRHMAALAQLPTVRLMRSADIRAPSSQEVLPEAPEAKGRQVDGHRHHGVGLRNGGLPSTMTFYCVVCKSPVLVNSAIMSDNYHGGRGPAFLVDWVLRRVVVEETMAYTTTFTTGRYVVCDIKCSTCNFVLGKKYLASMDPANSFKADKFLIEQSALYVPQCCRRGASPRK
ncbi:j-protein (type III), partial [Perkinsus olseni]